MPGDEPQEQAAASESPIESQEWYAARHATTVLRDALRSAEMERDFPYLRADLNAFGHGFVELGRIAPDTAERLAELLCQGLAITRPASSVEGEPK